jgi:hypothetical protein
MTKVVENNPQISQDDTQHLIANKDEKNYTTEQLTNNEKKHLKAKEDFTQSL